jgi:hypothetical protein
MARFQASAKVSAEHDNGQAKAENAQKDGAAASISKEKQG